METENLQLELFIHAPVIRERAEILEFERLINEIKAMPKDWELPF